MKILHIANINSAIGGVSTVLSEQVFFENKTLKIESDLYNIGSFKFFLNQNYYDHINYNEFEKLIKKRNYDIIIFHSLYLFKYIKLSKILIKNKKEYYIKPHGGFSKKVQEFGFIKKKIANLIYFNSFIKKSLGIIYLNKSEKEHSYFLSRNKKNYFQENGIKSKKIKLKKNDKKIKIFYLGRFDLKYKGLDKMFESLIKIQNKLKKVNISIEIYGCGDKKSEKKIQNYMKKIEIKNIELKGKLIGEEKISFLKKANIMILLSKSEGMPMGILEAVSYGIPCIVTEETNMSDILIENVCGWKCNYKNFSEVLLKSIKEYNQNKDKYIKCCQVLSETYLWESEYIKKTYVELYNTLIEVK